MSITAGKEVVKSLLYISGLKKTCNTKSQHYYSLVIAEHERKNIKENYVPLILVTLSVQSYKGDQISLSKQKFDPETSVVVPAASG